MSYNNWRITAQFLRAEDVSEQNLFHLMSPLYQKCLALTIYDHAWVRQLLFNSIYRKLGIWEWYRHEKWEQKQQMGVA